MSASYLHGVETIEVKKGAKAISVVKSAVIALVGIAPKGAAQALTLVSNPTDGAQFGSPLTGFTIPQALDAIFKQGAGTVLVVNVFDSATHTSQVTAEAMTVTGYKTKTAFNPIDEVVVKNTGGTVTHTKGTDYSIDEYGNIVVLAGSAIVEGSSITATYKKLNGTAVNSAAIVGAIDGSTGVHTGMQLFDQAYTLFGMKPRILIAPNYSTLAGVGAELIVKANKYKGHCIIDAPAGTQVNAAITARGPAGTISNWNTGSKRAILAYPMLKAYDAATDSVVNTPFSQWLAGVIAATDNSLGYWVSPSNKQILGVLGLELPISADISDATSHANLLNEKGIVTVFNSFGTGFRVWGNRSAAFPSMSSPEQFICVQRTADVVHESLELAQMDNMDAPVDQVLIDTIRDSGNMFVKTLIGRGALVDGEVTFNPDKNPSTELAAGHILFSLSMMPPPPFERGTFESTLDINYLKSLK